MSDKLAIDGGQPVRTKPFPPRIQIGREEYNAVMAVMKASMEGDQRLFRYSGPNAEALEKEAAELYEVKYAAASSSGTASVHLAVAVLNLEPGDEVIVPPVTDQGTVFPILWHNAIPVFADINPKTFNIKGADHPADTGNHRGASSKDD